MLRLRALRRTLALLALLLLLAAATLALATTAHAQATKIFVASYGNDANDGSRGSPKRNFQPAHDAVAAGGEIVVLDTAGYGALAIKKSLAVTVPPGVNGFVTVSSGNAISITAGSGDTVSLRGLIVEGGGSSIGSGIYVGSVGTLAIEDCTVRNFGQGIYAYASTAAQIAIYNTSVRTCQYGLYFSNSAAINVHAVATGCRLDRCTITGAECAAGTNGAVDLTLESSTVHSGGVGLLANGATSVLLASNCTITDNASQGASSVSGGQVISRVNNTLVNNAGGNTFPGTYSAK
ncbi:MAG: right-handed parallel beta-helix repeat-containing protein [Verrucomicrobia bacterium]|nr:right-handed parallel beta-helix repeat-containing protein [Verrucomicrobiota bacterium]